MSFFEANAHFTKVGVFMGDHAQDVVKAINLPRYKTVGDLIDDYLTENPKHYITIRAVETDNPEYDVSRKAFEAACEDQAPWMLDDLCEWPDGYEEQGVSHVRDVVMSTFTAAGLSVEPGPPPAQEGAAW